MRFCLAPRCNQLVDKGYCEKHKTLAPSRISDSQRGSSSSRGYDSAWRQFRLNYLRQNPLCSDCLERGIVEQATEIHHIAKLAQHPDRKYDPANLLCLCHRCHAARTGKGE